jgi:hypothetical protein
MRIVIIAIGSRWDVQPINARILGEKIREENGVKRAVDAIMSL